MFSTLSNSWGLARECWDVLMKDKEMLVYPLLTTIANIAIVAVAYVYFKAIGFSESSVPLNYTGEQWLLGGTLIVATMYACHFTYSFFECALVAAAVKRLKGENPTLGFGLNVASNRIPQIAGWSFYMTIFGIFVTILKSLLKSVLLQKLVGKISFTLWNVVTVFVLPLIVIEEMSATNAAKRSTSMIKERWGEAATLEIGFGSLNSIAAVPLAGLFMIAGLLQSTSYELSIAIVVFTVVLALFLGTVVAALMGIAKAVLFNYVTSNHIPDEVHREILDGMIVHKDDDGNVIGNQFQT